MENQLINILRRHRPFHPVVPFNPATDKIVQLDFSAKNSDLTPELLGDVQQFTQYVFHQLHSQGAYYGIGGYAEHRTIYSRSEVFDSTPLPTSTGMHARAPGFMASNPDTADTALLTADEPAAPRRLHLGVDIWGPVHTKVMAPLDGIVHSFGFHPEIGNYGAVIILVHQLNGTTFHTLYGHLSYASIKNLREGQHIARGDVFASFGIQQENGWWPPHLHFQVIQDMQGWKGDYPGVCAFSEKDQWLRNCIDPDLILNLNRFVAK